MATSPGGGIHIERTRRRAALASFRHLRRGGALPQPQVSGLARGDHALYVHGRGFTPLTEVVVDGRWTDAEYVDEGTLRLRPCSEVRAGAAVSACNGSPLTLFEDPGEDEPVSLEAVEATAPEPLGTGCPFALQIRFRAGRKTPARVLELTLKPPGGEPSSRLLEISERESSAGAKLVEGLSVARGGILLVRAALYDESGRADYLERGLAVVPSNPLQLYIDPLHDSPRGVGAAGYRSSSDRYYCEGNWTVSNGNDFPVVVGPLVRCRTSDSGIGELDDFSFTIEPFTIAARSTGHLSIYTYFPSGTDTYDLFKDHGDARFDFSLMTSGGWISDWHVWVGAAQVGVTANFVGSFSWAEFNAVVDAIETHASAIYSGFDCVFSADTPVLVIPSDHPDWERYRDIRVEESKSGVCSDSDEADDLRDHWSSPGAFDGRLDLFFVESFSGDICASSVGGFSPVDGPTGKGGSSSGAVIDVKDLNILSSETQERLMGLVVAHEVGHFLGLEHSTAANNFMRATGSVSNTRIDYDQWKEMRDHGFVRRLEP